MAKHGSETPLMQQYYTIKKKYPGAMLLFRVGDFYETFGEDAIKASKILDIVLAKRANGSAAYIELAGFPYHSIDNYLPKLVRAGQRVAICDQLEDPKMAKGIVKRGVTELVTPGVSLNDNVLETRSNNFLASLFIPDNANPQTVLGAAFLDISTGEFWCSQGDLHHVGKLLQSLKPSEIIYCKNAKAFYEEHFGTEYSTYRLDDWVFAYDYAFDKLTAHFKAATLKGFGIDGMDAATIAAGAVLHYLEATEHKQVSHISALSRIETEHYVWLDKFTIRNLELLAPQHENGVPLIAVLDETVTPMGARMLKRWVAMPLKSAPAIQDRLHTVGFFVENEGFLDQITLPLKQIGDLERLASKVAVGRISPREMVQLKRALKNLPGIGTSLKTSALPQLQKIGDQINPCALLCEKIDRELKEEAPNNALNGNLIQDGINTELDELRAIAFNGKDILQQIQERESIRSGIPSLKISYNRVFGYYLEVRNAHKEKVPQDWIRKQTLVGAERYITPELKVWEEKILGAEDKINSLEFKMFAEILAFANDYVLSIQQNARLLAQLDCLCSFAVCASKNNYAMPEVSDSKKLEIIDGRHPVIEKQLPPGTKYIPNDISLDDEDQQIIVVTGPNMSGKSALLRQTALIVLMAQMGSFVPAKSAKIGVVDKVFTRVGASDNLSRGESTFMVEMTETASILNNLSDRSLILMDEIGRGTSTYDGISIAWSIVEHLHNHPKFRPKTLFATHYHELNQLEEDFPRIHNYSVSVKELDNKVVFMRKLKKGGSEHSFGIHVAQMAGMPNGVVIRASEIMQQLEKDKIKEHTRKKIKEIPKTNYQLHIFDAKDPRYETVKEMIAKLDINRISPVEALMKLNEIKNLLG